MAPQGQGQCGSHLGEPGDVAVLPCKQEARFVASQSILVNGGFDIAGPR